MESKPRAFDKAALSLLPSGKTLDQLALAARASQERRMRFSSGD
jgi:hypothetical protein